MFKHLLILVCVIQLAFFQEYNRQWWFDRNYQGSLIIPFNYQYFQLPYYGDTFSCINLPRYFNDKPTGVTVNSYCTKLWADRGCKGSSVKFLYGGPYYIPKPLIGRVSSISGCFYGQY